MVFRNQANDLNAVLVLRAIADLFGRPTIEINTLEDEELHRFVHRDRGSHIQNPDYGCGCSPSGDALDDGYALG